MSIVCIIQSRMSSSRLPQKITKPILNKSMLWWVIYRIKKSKFIDQVVIATTTDPNDDQLVEICKEESWPYFRGSENDVLDRYYHTAKKFGAAHIVRLTSDCPAIDPIVSDYTVASYLSAAPSIDYASNVMVRTYPRGLDTEIFSFTALETAWGEDKSPIYREHVTPYLYNKPNKFRLLSVTNPYDYSKYRWTVDTAEDLELICQIYEYFGHGDFSWQDILNAHERHPNWVNINHHVQQKQI